MAQVRSLGIMLLVTALTSGHSRRFRIPWESTALILIVFKPIADALAVASPEVQVDFGTLWTSLSFVLLAAWLLTRKRAGASTWLFVFLLGLLAGWTVIQVSMLAGPPALLEGSRVLVSFAPAVILLNRRAQVLSIRWRRYVVWFLAAVGVHVVAAWLQFAGLLGTTYTQLGQGRPSGLFFHPVSLGYLLVSALLVVSLLHMRGVIARSHAVLFALCIAASVVISTHRASAVVTAALMIAWMLATMVRSRPINKKFVGVTTAICIFVAIVAAASTPLWIGPVREAGEGLVGPISVQDLDPTSERFLRGRGEIWLQTIDEYLRSGPVQLMFGFGHQTLDPHTDYLRIVFVHGLVGGSIVVAVLLLWILLPYRRTDRTGRIWIGLAVVAMAMYAITIKPTSFPSFVWAWTFLFWLTVATRRSYGQAVDKQRIG